MSVAFNGGGFGRFSTQGKPKAQPPETKKPDVNQEATKTAGAPPATTGETTGKSGKSFLA